MESIRKYQGMQEYTEIDWDELRAVYLSMCMNLEAVDEILEQFLNIEIILIESGGDNLSATFSPELAAATIFVIDVAEGDKILRKGGPDITRSDLLVINKIDLAPMVEASLAVMESDAMEECSGSNAFGKVSVLRGVAGEPVE